MDRNFKRKAGLLLCSLFMISSMSFSQVKNFDFFKSAPADATKFLKAYMAPWTDAFGAGLNSGWYNTAKPHKLLGFDLTMSINAGMVPSSAKEFDLSSLNLTSIAATGKTPTIAGATTAGPPMQYKVTNNGVQYTVASFNAPKGTGWKFVPVPTAQVGLGLPMGTEIKGRFIPKIKIGSKGDISMWGVGLMHNLTQYLPGDKLLPFDVSLFGGYTKLNANIGLNVDPGTPQNYTTPYSATSFDNQKVGITVTALNVNAIASLNLPVITLYGGLGYSKTKTEMAVSGNFPTPTLNTSTGTAEYTNNGVMTGAKFPAISIENFSGVRANIGLRIKLAIITIHADYTRAQYNVFATGLGFTFR